jgi:RNA polymerase sigma-70 factor, ECF subfamily
MINQDRYKLFSDLASRYEGELYGYIFSIVRNWEDSADLYQAVCLVLWSKFDLFQPGDNFLAWARVTAKNKVRNFIRHKRLRRYASDAVLDVLSTTTIELQSDNTELYAAALRRCKSKLNNADQELLELRYAKDIGSRQLADMLNRSQQSVCRSLTRIHRWLLECIQMELALRENSEESPS